MQAREKQLAELKTTFVESKKDEEYHFLVKKLATELDSKSSIEPIWIQKLPLELIMQLPPELLKIIFLYAREYYLIRIDILKENIFNIRDTDGGLYINEVEKLRKAVEVALSTYQFDLYSLVNSPNTDINKIRHATSIKNTPIYITYSRMQDNDKNIVKINIHGYYICRSNQTIVLSKPIRLRFEYQEDKTYPNLVIEHVFAEAIFIYCERSLTPFSSSSEPLGTPYQYFIGDKKSKSDVTQQLQDCHRLFAHNTTVKSPHKPLPSLTSSRIFCRDQVGENSELDTTYCHLASSTEGEKSTLNQQKSI